MKVALASIGAVIILVVVVVAGWLGGWWLREETVNRQVRIDNRNKGVQVAWRDEARNAITDYNLVDPSNTAARGALRVKACSLIDRLVPSYYDDDLAQFEAKEC